MWEGVGPMPTVTFHCVSISVEHLQHSEQSWGRGQQEVICFQILPGEADAHRSREKSDKHINCFSRRALEIRAPGGSTHKCQMSLRPTSSEERGWPCSRLLMILLVGKGRTVRDQPPPPRTWRTTLFKLCILRALTTIPSLRGWGRRISSKSASKSLDPTLNNMIFKNKVTKLSI